MFRCWLNKYKLQVSVCLRLSRLRPVRLRVRSFRQRVISVARRFANIS